MFDRFSPKSKKVLVAIVLSVAASICKNSIGKCSIEFVDPGYYHFQSIDRHLEYPCACHLYIEADIVND
jgi:hypothetical protein